jgi:hypothetical protein
MRTATAIVLTIGMFAIVAMIIALPSIHQWERDNGYPYGKLCELYRQCR